MEKNPPPVRIISLGRVYRPDTADADPLSDVPSDGRAAGRPPGHDGRSENAFLRLFATSYLGHDVHIRFRPSFFPFTEPSVEVDMSWSGRLDRIRRRGHGRPERAASGRLRPGASVRASPSAWASSGSACGATASPTSASSIGTTCGFCGSSSLERVCMIVSWNWLKDYVDLAMAPGEVERRLMMAGLNHEATERVGGDLAIDLEVTSNRPDCLGHIGVAREIAVLFGTHAEDARRRSPPAARTSGGANWPRCAIDCPELCPRYTARVISRT